MKPVISKLVRSLACALGLLFIVAVDASGQGINYRAQGHYYSAKEAFEKGRYTEAIDYVNKSKEALGGTNDELQYLHVLSAYNGGRYTEAQKELNVFFQLEEKKLGEVHFSNSVDRLTNNEIKQLTMLINKIDGAVESSQAAARAAAAKAAEDARLARNLDGLWTIKGGTESGLAFSITGTAGPKMIGVSQGSSERGFYIMDARRVSETDTQIQFLGKAGYAFRCHYRTHYGEARYDDQSLGFVNVRVLYDKAARVFRVDLPPTRSECFPNVWADRYRKVYQLPARSYEISRQ